MRAGLTPGRGPGSKRRPRLGLGLAAALALGGCEDQSYRDIGGEIGILTSRSDRLIEPATERLCGYGRHAIPQIETALHTASETGRRNLLGALHAIGDAEAIPILRHFSVYDGSPIVRAEAETILGGWAGHGSPRAEAASAALKRIAELRAMGEGPAPARPSAAR